MSGLLWSALGGAIANTGNTIAQGMMRDAEYRQRIDDEEIREKRRMENQIKLEEERARREDARKETVARQQADILDRAEKGAERIGDDRRFDKFRKDARAAGYEADDDTLRKVFNDQYNQQVVGNFEGADRYREKYSKEREDVLNEVRRLGGNSDSVRQAREAVSIAQTAERDDARERRDRRDGDRRDLVANAQVEALTKNAESNRIRAERTTGGGSGGGGKTPDSEKPITGVDLERAAKAAEKSLALSLGVPVNELQRSIAAKRRRGELTPDQQAKVDSYELALSRWENYKRTDSGDTAPKPSGGGQNVPEPKVIKFDKNGNRI